MLLGCWACSQVPAAAGSAAGLLPADNLADQGASPSGHPTHEARDCLQQCQTPVKQKNYIWGLQTTAAYAPCHTASRRNAGARQGHANLAKLPKLTYPDCLALKDLLAPLLWYK